MKVHFCVISFVFDFLALDTIKALKDVSDKDLFVIHTHKKPSNIQWHLFRGTNLFDGEPRRSHGSVLDDILVRHRWPSMVNCDRIVFVDHDVVMDKASFGKMSDQLCIPHMQIVAFKSPFCKPDEIRTFITHPAFSVDPQYKWPTTWSGTLRDGVHYDSGQLNGQLCGASLLHDIPDYMHFWGSWWYGDSVARRNERYAKTAIEHYTERLASGAWHPNDNDKREMRKYFILQNALRRLEHG